MNRSLKSLALTLFLLLGAALPTARAERPPHDFTKLPFIQELGLTDTQKQQIESLQEKFRTTLEPKRQAVTEARQALDAAMDSQQEDGALREKFKTLSKAQDDMRAANFEQALAIRKILTPEQRTKFRELKGKMFEEMRKNHPGMPFLPPPPP